MLKNLKLLSITLCLAGCGGSGSGVRSTPVPTPAPTPTPTPTPTTRTPITQGTPPPVLPPVTTGTLIDAIKVNADFRTGSTEVTEDLIADTYTSRNKAYDSSTSIRVYFDAATGNYIVSNVIGVAHRFTINASNSDGFTYYFQGSMDAIRRLSILTPSASNPRLALTYTSYGVWQLDTTRYSGSDPQINDYHFFYFGIPTPADTMPRTGSATYNGVAEGVILQSAGNINLFGTMALTANFTAASLTTTLALSGTNISTSLMTTLPTLNGVATIGAGTNGFRGEITTADNSFVGSVQGAFFGPTAQEVGYSFAINNPELTRIGGGVAVGKR